MQKLTYTINEATEALGIGRSRLYGLFREGRIKPRKLGKRTLILADELKRLTEGLPVQEIGSNEPTSK